MGKHASCILVCMCVCVREGVLPITASAGKLRPKGVTDTLFACEKVEKMFWFCDL